LEVPATDGYALELFQLYIVAFYSVIIILLTIFARKSLISKIIRTIMGLIAMFILFYSKLMFILAITILLIFIWKPFHPTVRKRIITAISILLFSIMFYYAYKSIIEEGLDVAVQLDRDRIQYNGDIYYPILTSYNNRYGLNKDLGRIRQNYEPISLIFYSKHIMSIKYDPLLNYIYFNNQIYSKTDSEIKIGNKVTSIFLGSKCKFRITDQDDINLILSLSDLRGEPYSYNAESSGRFSEYISVAYDNCPISALNIGTIAKIYDTWIYVPVDSHEYIKNSNGKETLIYKGVIINDPYITNCLLRIAYDNSIISLIQADPSLGLPADYFDD